jgi:hypothetical protein
MRRIAIAIGVWAAVPLCAHAQWVVHDAATTARNAVTAAVKEQLLDTERRQHERIRRMAERLSVYTDLRKYVTADPPAWARTNPRTPAYAGGLDAALRVGDARGQAYVAVAHPLMAAPSRPWSSSGRRQFAAGLATVEVADAANISAVDAIGRVRVSGMAREQAAVAALEGHVVDPSRTQSATAVLDKISGAMLVGARQRQARVQLLTGLVEQLLVDSKRARDTEATAANMQIVTWRQSAGVNQAFRAGVGDALRSWRQP